MNFLLLMVLIVSVLIHSCKEKTQAHHMKIKIVLRSCVIGSCKLAKAGKLLSQGLIHSILLLARPSESVASIRLRLGSLS